jgi:hypothetical protein
MGRHPDERALFENVLVSGGMTDMGRSMDTDNDQLFTWWPPWRNMRQKNIGWRIDYILASQLAAARIVRCYVLPHLGTSDYAPVIAEITLWGTEMLFAASGSDNGQQFHLPELMAPHGFIAPLPFALCLLDSMRASSKRYSRDGCALVIMKTW